MATQTVTEVLDFEEARRVLLRELRRSEYTGAPRRRLAQRVREGPGWPVPYGSTAEQLAGALAYYATDDRTPPKGRTERALVALVRDYSQPDAWWEQQYSIERAVEAGGLRPAFCPRCEEEVLWGRTDTGESIPLDLRPRAWDDGGRFVLQHYASRTERKLKVVLAPALQALGREPDPDDYFLSCHLDRCPDEE